MKLNDAIKVESKSRAWNLAFNLALNTHAGQKDKGGRDYMLHVVHVCFTVKGGVDEQVAALLHDVIEDGGLSLSDLEAKGFSREVIDAVDHLTKRNGENYINYIDRLSKDKIAVAVKIADLKHNMDITRLKKITDKDLERLKKYHTAYKKLIEIMVGEDE